MKRLFLVAVVLALALAGCDTASNNSDDDSRYYSKDRNRTSDTDILSGNDIRLIDVKIDSRDFSTLEISTCPLATEVGTGSCNAVTP